MPKLSLSDLIITLIIGVIVLIAIGWVVSPLIFKKDIETATNEITSTATETVEEKREVSKETNANAAEAIQRTQARTVAAAGAASDSTDGDATFFEFVCNSRLYEADPQCRSRGGEGR